MAGGIFGAAALQNIPAVSAAVTQPLTIALAIGWAGMAVAIAVVTMRQGLAAYTGSVIGSFAIGTWIAASTVLGRMVMLAAPAVLWPAEMLYGVGLGLWVWFIPRAIRNLVCIARRPASKTRPTGVILLTAVATQAVALLGFRLFPDAAVVRWFGLVLMAVGGGAYVAGIALIARRYAAGGDWRLTTDWDNTNCILHGALSITGLAAAVSRCFAATPIIWLWLLTAAMFISVEAVEIARVTARVRAFGWRKAVLVYRTSQWARNFTFGMFYAFTAALAGSYALADFGPALGAVASAVIGFGQYVVAALLAAELGLMGCWFAGRLER